jgi:hypothetical protein
MLEIINKIIMSWKNTINTHNVPIWLGTILLIISGLLLITGKKVDQIIALMVLLGIMSIMVNFFNYVGMEKPRDERLQKIGTLSATYSWYITLVFISFLLITSFWAGRERNMAETIGITIIVMSASLLAINTYLTSKGDIG